LKLDPWFALMSEVIPKADIGRHCCDVRYVPIADINNHLFSAVI